MIVDVPPLTPVTRPVAALTVAMPVRLLLHAPPLTASVSEVVRPWHTTGVPSIAEGAGLTVTTVAIQQLPGIVYVIVAVPPVTPVTTPVPVTTLAVPGAEELQVPPVTASLNEVVKPTHTLGVPRIAVGDGLTVTTAVV